MYVRYKDVHPFGSSRGSNNQCSSQTNRVHQRYPIYDALNQFYHKPEECLVLGSKFSNVDVANYDGETALMFACHQGHLHVVRRLLQCKASLMLQSDAGE